jgi:peroxidase
MDLVALNIQRARDHGLAGYMSWRALCSLPTFTSWKGLAMIFPSMVVARLQALYKSVEDIDIFVGGILEVSGDFRSPSGGYKEMSSIFADQ